MWCAKSVFLCVKAKNRNRFLSGAWSALRSYKIFDKDGDPFGIIFIRSSEFGFVLKDVLSVVRVWKKMTAVNISYVAAEHTFVTVVDPDGIRIIPAGYADGKNLCQMVLWKFGPIWVKF